MTAYPYRLPRRYRYRPRGRNGNTGPAVAAVVIAALVAASGAKAAGHSGHHAALTDAPAAVSLPGSTSLRTPAGWDHAFLAALGDPQTSCDVNAVAEWMRREGGGFGNQAAFNALNVNPPANVGWPGHPAIGAWAFPDAATGLRYTVATLNNGDYGGILAALKAGNSAQAVCDAIMASPWAASRYDGTLTASC
jgi:hypothetical protein